MTTVPSPASTAEPTYTARALLREIQKRGGRVYRMPLVSVFALTRDPDVAQWLVDMGGRRFVPVGMDVDVDGGYWVDQSTKQIREWDIYIHTIPVRGDQTIHEAAKRNKNVEYAPV